MIRTPADTGAGGDTRGRARVGVIVPMSNTNLEPDMIMLRPPGVSLHFARAGGYDLDAVPDAQQMRDFASASIEEVVRLLVAARPDVVLYGCTSATLACGAVFDAELCARIQTLAEAPAVTAAGAVVEALNALGVKRIAFSSPYVEALNNEALAFLAECGFETVSCAHVGSDLGNYEQGELEPADVIALAERADNVSAQALVLSCTDMRAVEVREVLEARLGKPVVTSNHALMTAAVRRLSERLPDGSADSGRTRPHSQAR